ncbi:chaperonin family protein RbcX [Synechocystis sp. LKSZ1]|uniref:chaperonin family protein RbcX n=1 Tax=Synechocystis sp. LKSZ1 TaxID=3144951 RepID=UPI00336C05E7
MGTKQVAEATAKVLQSYLTYQAVKTILMELGETNPPQALWLNQYMATHGIQDGEAFLEELLNDNKELVLRILTVREVLADTVLDFLPGMVRQSIGHSNTEHRRHLLERLTRAVPPPESELPDFPSP